MRTFFEVISRAGYFIHFSSWGISHVMIGALKMASTRVPVHGFVSDVEAHAKAELTEYLTGLDPVWWTQGQNGRSSSLS
jgi:hypothetical protein